MPTHVAFLRGINLGNRRVKNDELARLFEQLGLDGVATYQAAGNVVFDHDGEDTAALEARIEAHLEDALGYDVATFVRPLADLRRLAGLGFIEPAREDGFTPHLILLKGEAPEDAALALKDLETPDDRFHVAAGAVFWMRRGGLGDAPISTRELEKALGGPGDNTMRNLNTIQRMVKKFGDPT